MVIKQKRNEQCACNSGKKYKKCCELNTITQIPDYSFTNQEKLELILEIITTIHPDRKGYTFINITDYLTNVTYRTFQLDYYNKKTIMMAKRNITNEDVFLSRSSNPSEDIIIMYKGAYLVFDSDKIYNMTKSIDNFITKLDNNITLSS